jgi:hypothetical protein
MMAAATLWALTVDPALAQVVTENAGVTSPEIVLLRQGVLYQNYENGNDLRWVQGVQWAIDPKREFRLSFPIIAKTVDFADSSTSMFGPGDVTIRYKQSLWQADGVMSSERWAFLSELGLPTGATDARGAGGELLPPRLQLGSGSFSLGAGTAYTSIHDRHRFSVEAFYRHYLPASGTRLGSAAELNAAYWYRLSPASFPEDEEPVEIRGVMEVLSSYRFDGEVLGNPGGGRGVLVWLAPGLQIYPPGQKVLLEGSVLIPIAQSLSDELGKRRFGILGTVKILF